MALPYPVSSDQNPTEIIKPFNGGHHFFRPLTP